MSRTANVHSVEALQEFRAGLCLFSDEAAQALATVRLQIDRFSQWLKHDQLTHWKHQIRVREDRVAEAKSDLHRCLAATIDPNRTPSCYQEKKLLEAAKRSLEEAEQKLAAVRRWIPIVDQAAMDYQARAEGLATALSSDLPKATAHLDRSVARLNEYLELSAPSLLPASSLGPAGGERSATGPADIGSVPSTGPEIVDLPAALTEDSNRAGGAS